MLRPELILPGVDTVASLVERLTPFEDPAYNPAARGTQKFTVEGRPDLLVRRDTMFDPNAIPEADRGFMNLRLRGVNVLPYAVMQTPDELYVITYKVTGQPLEEALRSEQDTAFVEQVDSLYTKLGDFLLGAWEDGKPTALDVFGPQQYMYGTVETEQEPNIKLVDLGLEESIAVLELSGDLCLEAIEIANDTVNAEEQLGRPGALAKSRGNIRRLFATDLDRHPDAFTSALQNLGNQVLDTGVPTVDHRELWSQEIIEKYYES